MTSETTIRGIKQTFEAIQTYEGEGFLVSRPIGSPRLDYLDPILLLDEFGPVDHKPLAAKGAPFHPHRGFQTVSYILEGEVQHTDSLGNHGILKSGDVQWMVAGSGVIHDEVPTPKFKREGGRMHGFQLWVNLPKSLKMCAPDYQDVRADKIPVVNFEGGSIKVIAGEAFGTKAVIETKVPTQYLDCKLNSKSKLVHQFPNDFNGFVYCYKGSVFVGNDESTVRLTRGHIAVLENNGNAFQAITTEGEASFLFIAGQPLNEPMARRGPFVMNTNAEIRQAFEDYYSGKFVMQKGTMSIQTNYDE